MVYLKIKEGRFVLSDSYGIQRDDRVFTLGKGESQSGGDTSSIHNLYKIIVSRVHPGQYILSSEFDYR